MAAIEGILIYGFFSMIVFGILITNINRFRRRQRENLERLPEADLGQPMAQFPHIDQSRCLGCGACAVACPEGDVLGVVFGKAELLNPLRCVGHGACATACPMNAIRIGLGDARSRGDIPLLDESLQTNIRGMFIAGELGGISLIHNAIKQGRAAVEKIACSPVRSHDSRVLDVVVVGAGPAGISAALTARAMGLLCVILEQGEVGGSILQYPRQKLITVQPVEFPLYGKLPGREFTKEALLKIWREIIDRFDLRIQTGQKVRKIQRKKGLFIIETPRMRVISRHVVLALGRRGTPRKLNIPGENLGKVCYHLVDARAYQHQQILVVGGGDNAAETAIVLAQQPGNRVFISYRKHKFLRIKKQNQDRIDALIGQQRIIPLFNTTLAGIRKKSALLQTENGLREFPNDTVFIMIGGEAPFQLLREMGIAFGGDARKPIPDVRYPILDVS